MAKDLKGYLLKSVIRFGLTLLVLVLIIFVLAWITSDVRAAISVSWKLFGLGLMFIIFILFIQSRMNSYNDVLEKKKYLSLKFLIIFVINMIFLFPLVKQQREWFIAMFVVVVAAFLLEMTIYKKTRKSMTELFIKARKDMEGKYLVQTVLSMVILLGFIIMFYLDLMFLLPEIVNLFELVFI